MCSTYHETFHPKWPKMLLTINNLVNESEFLSNRIEVVTDFFSNNLYWMLAERARNVGTCSMLMASRNVGGTCSTRGKILSDERVTVRRSVVDGAVAWRTPGLSVANLHRFYFFD